MGDVESRELVKTMATRSISELKRFLVEHGETSEGCIEKDNLVRRAVGAIQRGAVKRSASTPGAVSTSSTTSSSSSSRPPSTAKAAGVSHGGVCVICYDGDELPRPIQSGCACRGHAGLAHVECRAEYAAHRMASEPELLDLSAWVECGTCKQRFTGAMQLGLAEACCATTKHLPEEDKLRIMAAGNLASAVHARGRLAEAEAKYREILAVMRRAFGQEDPNTMAMAMNLATALAQQQKYAQAETAFREMLAVQRRVLGPEDRDTLTSRQNLATLVTAQGKVAEAEALYRDVLPVLTRLLGPEHPDTLRTMANLGNALARQHKEAEAQVIYREVLASQKQVLGPAHPQTLLTNANLATTLDRQGRFVDAQAMYREVMAAQQRVLGPNHPETLRTSKFLDICVRSARGAPNSHCE